jgi:hypothetical protein
VKWVFARHGAKAAVLYSIREITSLSIARCFSAGSRQ